MKQSSIFAGIFFVFAGLFAIMALFGFVYFVAVGMLVTSQSVGLIELSVEPKTPEEIAVDLYVGAPVTLQEKKTGLKWVFIRQGNQIVVKEEN